MAIFSHERFHFLAHFHFLLSLIIGKAVENLELPTPMSPKARRYKTLKRQYETPVAFLFILFFMFYFFAHCVQLIMSPGTDSVNANPKCNAAADTRAQRKKPISRTLWAIIRHSSSRRHSTPNNLMAKI